MMTADDLRRLASPEFNRILAGDPILSDLRSRTGYENYDRRNVLEAIGLSGQLQIGALPVRPLTIAKVALLWVLDNALLPGAKNTHSDCDLDVFLFVISRVSLQDLAVRSLSDIPAAASGYSAAAALPPADLLAAVREYLQAAFLPLAVLPQTGDGTAAYDLDWLTRVTGIAARESGEPFEYCLHRLPLCCACALYVQWRLRECRTDDICHRPSEEVSSAIDARINELAREYLQNVDRTEIGPER